VHGDGGGGLNSVQWFGDIIQKLNDTSISNAVNHQSRHPEFSSGSLLDGLYGSFNPTFDINVN
jgi:hypothetical protein